ncbi:hypothetical protein QIH04_27740, partial [Klebsiella pneumoniae]|nr:hypothetical protein [Klebsiella pneumoniae]
EQIKSVRNPTPATGIASAIKNYIDNNRGQIPIIVFCMTKKETYTLAESLIKEHKIPLNSQMSLDFDGVPETFA